VLSGFSAQRQGPTSLVQVNYRFVQGGPAEGATYTWIVEQAKGVSGYVEFVQEDVSLEAQGGTLTMEAAIGLGPGSLDTLIALGPRSTSASDPEPAHISGKLYEGQSESALEPLPPGAEEGPAAPAVTVTLANPRRMVADGVEQAAFDYRAEALPEGAGFLLTIYGAEGGTIAFDVTEELRASPTAGTLRRPVAELAELAAPYEVQIQLVPFGSSGGPGEAATVSNVVSLP
jgi:hypothetical protein